MNQLKYTSRIEMQISGSLTVRDWIGRRAILLGSPSQRDWEDGYEDFLHQRLHLRYLNPIAILQSNGTFQGEGFSIVAIQATLIEFLASTVKGFSYRYRTKGSPALGPFEYDKSGDLFINFLTAEKPFMSQFTRALAKDFYSNIRCGLLHEARTKQHWSIWAQSDNGTVIDGHRKLIFRNDLHDAILEFLALYKSRLPLEQVLQRAFVRKIDSFCIE